MINLTYFDLLLTSFALVFAGGVSVYLKIGVEKSLATASLRMIAQLLLLGFILKAVFTYVSIWLFILMSMVMLCAAGNEVRSRQRMKLKGADIFLISTGTMGLITFTLTILTLTLIIGKQPWYTPQYAIPLLGMMLGNTMNGVSIGLDRLSSTIKRDKKIIETRLMLGHTASKAVSDIKRECIKSGMIPLINSMSAAGIITLPGMMTGQILAGIEPVEAVKYQILIMFLIAASSSLGTIISVTIAAARFFDARERLCLDKLIRD